MVFRFKNFIQNKWTKISLIAIIIVLLLFFGIRYYLSCREQSKDPLNFLPSNVFTLIKVNDFSNFQSLLIQNEAWLDFENLFSGDNIRRELKIVDSVLSQNKDIHNLWHSNQLFISSHFVREGEFETLFLLQLPHPSHENKVINFLSSNIFLFEQEASKNSKDNIFKFSFDSIQEPYYLSVKNGVVIFSHSKQLTESALSMSETQNNIFKDTLFMKLFETCGKDSPANIFVNNQFLYRFAHSVLSDKVLQELAFLNYFAQWSTFDINANGDKINFTGLTTTNQENSQWLDIFNNSSKQKISLVENVPNGTLFFLYLGFDDYEQLRENLSALSVEARQLNYEEMLDNIDQKTGISNVKDYIFPYIDKQLMLFSVPNRQMLDRIDNFGLIKITDEKVVEQKLIDICISTAQHERKTVDTVSYRGYKIIQIPSEYVFFDLFGNIFRHLDNTFVTVFQQSIVISTSKQGLIEYLNTMIAGRSLANNLIYQEFSKQLSSDANVFLYCSPRVLKNKFGSFVNNKYSELLKNNIDEFNNIVSLGIQFSRSNQLFLSNISIYRNTYVQDEFADGWETKIEAPIAAGPWFVKGADLLHPYIVIFDSFNQMYLLTDRGEVLWKLPIPEKPISRVFSVDTHKNGKYQYVFNSENHIFSIDRLGKQLEAFPIKLPQKASTPIAIFDYENNKDYRLMFAGIDNTIYNLNLKGETPRGWASPQFKTTILDSIKHFVVNNSDVIILKDINSGVYGISRRGVKQFEIKDLELNSYSKIYLGQKQCKCLVSTTQDGQIVEINTDGSYTLKTIGTYSSGHVFMYNDITGDNIPDYIFIDRGKLTVLDTSGEKLIEYDIANNIGRKAYYIENSPYGPMIIVFSSDGRNYYLINKDGLVNNEFEQLSSNTADFYYNKQLNKLFIATSLDNILIFNVIEK